MAKFRKKPVIVEAEQWFPDRAVRSVHGALPHECPDWVDYPEGGYAIDGPSVVTIHGQVTPVAPGDWIITEPDGIHHYPCRPEIFEATYEPVGETETETR